MNENAIKRSMGERAAKVAGTLYQCRDTVRRLWGDRYSEKIKLWSDAVERIAANKGVHPLEAGRELAAASVDGATQMVILAATVELIEPTDRGDI